MYEDARKFENLRNLRKERLLRMQTVTRPNYHPTSSNAGDSQALKVAVLAVILFALSGLMTGFAFGAFVHFSPAKSSNSTTSLTTTQQNAGNTTSTTTKKVNPVPKGIGWPQFISPYPVGTEIADGATVYSVSLQVTDKTNGNTWGNPVHASGITCKLWLVQHFPDKKVLNIPLSTLQNIQALQSPITGQVDGRSVPEIAGLSFASKPQTQLSNASGQATWQYTISPAVKAGTYDLVALTDWDGKAFNWSWVNIVIKRAG